MTSDTSNTTARGSAATSGRLGDLTAIVPAAVAGDRLDAVVARLFDEYSRSRLQTWIAAGFLTVDGQQRRGRDRLLGGEQILLQLPPDAVEQSWQESWQDGAATIPAEAMSIELVHSDQAIHIVNKPAGLVMHPAPGHRHGTLMNGLLYEDPSLVNVPRAGIVHRLDKDTTGLCVIARTLKAHTHLVRQLQERSMGREYLAVLLGDVLPGGSVRQAIGRHPRDRKRMAVVPGGKKAITHYRVVERLPGCALVAVNLETGRTHQIRVHMAHLGLPLLGDPVYGRRVQANRLPYTIGPEVVEFKRQALHAQKLTLLHPDSDETCVYTAELPADMQGLLDRLREGCGLV